MPASLNWKTISMQQLKLLWIKVFDLLMIGRRLFFWQIWKNVVGERWRYTHRTSWLTTKRMRRGFSRRLFGRLFGRKLEEKLMKKKRTPYSLPVSALPAPLMSAPFIQPLHLHPVYWGGGGGGHLTGVLLKTKVNIPVSFAGRRGIGEVIALSCIHRHMGPRLDRLSVTAR